MASASIQSTVTAPVAKATVTGASRVDLAVNDVVSLDSANTGSSYAWTLAYRPAGSAAAFSGSSTAKSPGSFTVDVEGSYLVLLQYADGDGTSYQYVQLTALTAIGSLKLIAAGVRVAEVPVPVDITAAGWADDQNANLNSLLSLVAVNYASGNVLVVDPEGGDYQTIQDAIDAAAGGSATEPWLICIRPGVYVEDLTGKPFVYLIGWPGSYNSSPAVRVRNATTGSHSFPTSTLADRIYISGITFEQTSATSDATVVSSGAGKLTLEDCRFIAGGSGSPQGPAFNAADVTIEAFRCTFESNSAASAGSYSVLLTDLTATLVECNISIRGLVVDNSNVVLRQSVLSAAGTYGVYGLGGTLTAYHSHFSGGTSYNIALNPAGAVVAGDLVASFYWCVLGTVIFDTTGVAGTKALTYGACVYGAQTFPGSDPTQDPSVLSATVFYDNASSGLSAVDVQAALDEIHDEAISTLTLDDAYNGGDVGITGSGRTIIASAGAVRVVDAASPSDPIPAGGSDGSVEVVGYLRLGALDKPEIELDPNPYGSGPLIRIGREILPNDAPFGAAAFFQANSSGSPSHHNYNWRGGTRSALGGGQVGRTILRGGDSLASTVDASSVYIQAGAGTHASGGDGGSVYLAPGFSAAGTEGVTWLVKPSTATAATLTAAGAFVGGVSGTVRFATEMGAIEIDVDSGDNFAAVKAKIDATGEVVASDAGGGVMRLTTTATGPNAEVYFLNADAGLDAALGGFSGQTMVEGTWPDVFDIDVESDGVIRFGDSFGSPMLYDASTGKLTVPGLIDPTGLIFDQAAKPATGAGKAAIFVSDGSGGLVQGNFYFVTAAGTATDISSGGGVTDHDALNNLSWTASGHTGTASRVAAFDGGGAASLLAIGTDLQAWGSNLDGLSSLAANGIVARTGAGTFAARTITGTTGNITVQDGDGVSGNPTIGVGANVVLLDASQTLTAKTLTNPTIGNFSNANHNHQGAAGGGTLDHGNALTGLSDDDHTQYALLAGRSGGQTLTGGTAAGNNLTLSSTSNGTKGKINAADPLGLSQSAPPNTTAAQGALFSSNGGSSTAQGELYYRKASDGDLINVSGILVPYHINMPEAPGDTVEYRGWVATAAKLKKVRVYMATVNTQDAYTLTITNNGTGNTVLNAASFNMNTLVSNTVTPLTLTATAADLLFSDAGRWTISLTSGGAFNGVGVYIDLVFQAV